MTFNSEVFGNHIQKKRIYSRLSLEELATITGVSISTISRVENGNTPDINTAIKLAHWYGTGIDYFIDFKNETHDTERH